MLHEVNNLLSSLKELLPEDKNGPLDELVDNFRLLDRQSTKNQIQNIRIAMCNVKIAIQNMNSEAILREVERRFVKSISPRSAYKSYVYGNAAPRFTIGGVECSIEIYIDDSDIVVRRTQGKARSVSGKTNNIRAKQSFSMFDPNVLDNVVDHTAALYGRIIKLHPMAGGGWVIDDNEDFYASKKSKHKWQNRYSWDDFLATPNDPGQTIGYYEPYSQLFHGTVGIS